MNCEKIRDLIATDYLDGQLPGEILSEIQAHLRSCGPCREFEQAMRAAAVEPFKKVQEVKPPEAVWERIKESIGAREREAGGLFVGLRDYLSGLLHRPRPAFALGTALAAFITVAVLVNISLGSRRQVNRYFQEQNEFLSGLVADTGGYPAPNQVDLRNFL